MLRLLATAEEWQHDGAYNNCARGRFRPRPSPYIAPLTLDRSLEGFLFCLFALTLAGPAHSRDALRIESVGLCDYYSFADPSPVRVHIPAASHAQSIELEFLAPHAFRRQPVAARN
jgi:hypothetical protein